MYIDFIEYRPVSVIKIEKITNGYLLYIDQIADLIKFTWIDKETHIAKWELQYKSGKIINTYYTAENGFDIDEEKGQQILDSIAEEDEIIIDHNKYEDIGITDYTGFYQYSDTKGITNIIDAQNIIMKLCDSLTIVATSRKIKGYKNKYALFFKKVYKSNISFDSGNYSTTDCIAELEILAPDEIKKT